MCLCIFIATGKHPQIEVLTMKHIAILGKYYPPKFGGVERYTADVARLAAKGHRVTVVVHSPDQNDQITRDGNITIIRCGTKKIINSQPLSPSMLLHLRGLQPDLVHFNAPNFWSAAMLALSGYAGPLIITHHADVFGRPILRQVVMPIYRRLLRRATCVVVNSLRNATSSRDLLGVSAPFIEIPWGIDPKAYERQVATQVGATSERKQRFGEAPVVGFVGRLVRYKGLLVLIEALSNISGVHAILIGDGPMRSQLVQQVDKAGIANRVHFAGNLDEHDKIREMRMMDMLILPSTDTTEAFGVSQVEAQLLGLPVVASSLPTGVMDVTLDNITGLLVPPGDAHALTNAISRLVHDQDLSERLGRAGRERALRLFTLDSFERRFAQLFDAVLCKQPLSDLTHPTKTDTESAC
jgi:glycosyltransferase involved in cell wall biosynthesis